MILMCHPAWCSGSRSIPAWCIGEAEDVRPGPEGGCGVTNFSRFGALNQMERYLTRKWRLNFGIYWIRQHNQFIAMIVLQLFLLWYYARHGIAFLKLESALKPLLSSGFHAVHLRIDGSVLWSMIEWVGDCGGRGMGRRYFFQRLFVLFYEAEWCCWHPPTMMLT